jgi:hypothetical protein
MLVAEVLAVDNKPSSISIPERNGTGRAKNDCHLGNEEFKANPAGQYQLLSQRLFRILWAVVFPAVGFLAILLASCVHPLDIHEIKTWPPGDYPCQMRQLRQMHGHWKSPATNQHVHTLARGVMGRETTPIRGRTPC